MFRIVIQNLICTLIQATLYLHISRYIIHTYFQQQSLQLETAIMQSAPSWTHKSIIIHITYVKNMVIM